MAVTVTDVARAAGVSVSTVSYVLSGSRKISEPTKKRVHKAIQDLGYTPNILARGLRGGHSKIIALVFPLDDDVLDPSGLDYILGASDYAQALGYHLMLWTTDGPGLDQLRELAGRGLVDGVLLMQVTLDDERPEILTKAKIPFAMIGRVAGAVLADSVDLDGAAAARTAVDYLAGGGHKLIGLVEQPSVNLDRGFSLAHRVREGAFAAAQDAAVTLVASTCEHSFEDGYSVTTRMLSENPAMTAVICHNELAVGGVLNAVADHGLRVPDDFSVVTVGMGETVARSSNPPLSTVSVSGRELGRLAAEHLLDRLAGDDSPVNHVIFPGDLVIRRSSGPAPSGSCPVLR